MSDSTPICRCRVLYLGSAVPRQSKDGLQGIQEPLKSLYPSEGAIGAKGIDSWLSVWSNGILLENVDENLKQITRFFPIESLHYCAAVRQVLIPEHGIANPEPKFLPLDSPFAKMPRAQHPPIFAAILRRTSGIKVLECHVFICKREAAANALVRCCFHSYADNSYVRQLETGGGTDSTLYGTLKSTAQCNEKQYSQIEVSNWAAGSTTTLNSVDKRSNGQLHPEEQNSNGIDRGSKLASKYFGKNLSGSSAGVVDDVNSSMLIDENHKIWNSSQDPINSTEVDDPNDIFRTSTINSSLGRTTRARQISEPIEVPPPPVKQDHIRNKKKSTKYSESLSLSGTLARPKPLSNVQRTSAHVPPHVIYSLPPHGIRQYHTISHRSNPFNGIQPLPNHFHTGISASPQLMSPQIIHAPTSVLMQKQFATLQSARSKKKRNKKNCSIPVGMPVVPPIYAYSNISTMYQQPSLTHPVLSEPTSVIMNRKLTASLGNDLDDCGISNNDSPEIMGIYKRKGHMNERAFSYSIRQEHRSRSHGSLASLQFHPPDIKKEREIAQMVAGLNLADNKLKPNEYFADIKKKQMSDGSCISENAPILYHDRFEPTNSFGKWKN